jgi:ferredoxin
MTTYTITLDSGETFACSDDNYILDAAEEQGVDLLCVSYPMSDCTIRANAEEDLA